MNITAGTRSPITAKSSETIQEILEAELDKVTKGKSIFPSDEALLKMLYLITQDVMLKWTGRIHNWGQILLQLSVFFPDKVKSHLK